MKRNHSSGLFLMEMIAVILFFSICSGICIQAFAKADGMSRKAENLNHAVVRAESIADTIRSENGNADAGNGTFYWDRNWKLLPGKENAEFRAVTESSEDDSHMQKSDITIYRNEEVLFQMTVEHYLKP